MGQLCQHSSQGSVNISEEEVERREELKVGEQCHKRRASGYQLPVTVAVVICKRSPEDPES